MLAPNFVRSAILLFALTSAQSAPGHVNGFRDCADCPLMRVLPPGRFVMGSPDSELGRMPSEGPQHEVKISRSFAIGVYDVTRAEFAVFARETGYEADAKCDWRSPKVRGQPINQGNNDPVVCISLHDAKAYANWMSAKTGHSYHLPSEAEWEYAARAGSSTPRPWGDRAARDFANYGADQCCAAFAAGPDRLLYTSPVGSFPANGFGLRDMLGNVWQRTEDCGHENYSGAPDDRSAWVTGGDCAKRMIRGGGWFIPLDQLRSAVRAADPSDFRKNDIGFRLVREH